MEFHNRMESPYAGAASVAVYRGGRFKWWRPTWSQMIPQGEDALFEPRRGERRTYSVLVDVRYRIPNAAGADLTYPEKRRLANLRDLGQRIVIEDGNGGKWCHFRLRTVHSSGGRRFCDDEQVPGRTAKSWTLRSEQVRTRVAQTGGRMDTDKINWKGLIEEWSPAPAPTWTFESEADPVGHKTDCKEVQGCCTT